MGSNAQADVPGNVYFHSMSFASQASNAANNVVGFFPAGQAISVLSVYVDPISSQAGSATNYDNIGLVNMGSGSAGTVVLASKTFSAAGASVDANVPGSFALGTVVTKASNEHLAISHTSAGNGIALVARTVHMAYRYI